MTARFSATVQTDPGAHPNSYTTSTWSFPGVKRLGLGFDHPPTSTAEVKGSRAIHLLPLWAFVACARVNFTFTLTVTIRMFWKLLKITELKGWDAKLTFPRLFLSTVIPSAMSSLTAHMEESYLPNDISYS